MTIHMRKRVIGCLSLLILFTFVYIHFLGDPCMLHGEHTAQAMESTLSAGAMTCLCFFHAVYTPVEVRFAVFSLGAGLPREPVSDGNIRLLILEIFHPPWADDPSLPDIIPVYFLKGVRYAEKNRSAILDPGGLSPAFGR